MPPNHNTNSNISSTLFKDWLNINQTQIEYHYRAYLIQLLETNDTIDTTIGFKQFATQMYYADILDTAYNLPTLFFSPAILMKNNLHTNKQLTQYVQSRI